ncbi:MAG: phosphodiester glycosidase family protein [Oscillospiraceae bacterium]|nr:phosphodiester glycosidase family protein [Oscillospiraceae bacterium]
MSDQTIQEKNPDRNPGSGMKVIRVMTTIVGTLFSLCLIAVFCYNFILSSGTKETVSQEKAAPVTIMDKFDMYVTNAIADALDGVLAIEKVYWLSDHDLVAPEPNPAGYGEVRSYEELVPILKKAEKLLAGQTLAFTPDRPVWDGDTIHYYYDETILVIAWKEIVNECVYTVAEVKVAHPSQFRRFLAGGEFGSDKQYRTTEMAASVNAVVASSGDFYAYRKYGAVVYESTLRRFEGENVDTCYITEDGDLLFTYRNQLKTEADAEKFIKDNKVRFSLAFGPVLVDGGEIKVPADYILGEVNGTYSRAAICQWDKLHYLIVNTSQEQSYWHRHKVRAFAEFIRDLGCNTAYALDGGQTTAIVMNDELVTLPDYQTQRRISDIIYFATALPNGG